MMKRLIVLGCIIWVILSLLGIQRHRNTGPGEYHSELWADKGGYYVYLPMWFNLGPAAKNYSNDLISAVGSGFKNDHESGVIATKYTCGIALLYSPFYLIANVFSPDSNGFSILHYRMTNVGAAFYATFGLLLLYLWLLNFFEKRTATITCAITLLATNLLFYVIKDGFMTHVYSFFIVTVLLNVLHQLTSGKLKWHWLLIFGFFAGLLVITRPTNLILLGFIVMFYLVADFNKWSKVWAPILKPKTLLLLALGGLMAAAPQLYYWHKLTGKVFYYSYGEEGFNFLDPEWMLNWFSTVNGLFLYTPIIAFVLIWMIVKSIKGDKRIVVLIGLFFSMSWIFASWSSWHFGCSFGQRSYIELFPLLAYPIAQMVSWVQSKNRFFKVIGAGLTCVFIWSNVSLTYAYDGCFYGDRWDWHEYFNLANSNRSWIVKYTSFDFTDDYEGGGSFIFETGDQPKLIDNNAFSGDSVVLVDHMREFGPGIGGQLKFLTGSDHLNSAHFSAQIKSRTDEEKKIFIVFHLVEDDKTWDYVAKEFTLPANSKNTWINLKASYPVGITLNNQWTFKSYIYNPNQADFVIDDLHVKLDY